MKKPKLSVWILAGTGAAVGSFALLHSAGPSAPVPDPEKTTANRPVKASVAEESAGTVSGAPDVPLSPGTAAMAGPAIPGSPAIAATAAINLTAPVANPVAPVQGAAGAAAPGSPAPAPAPATNRPAGGTARLPGAAPVPDMETPPTAEIPDGKGGTMTVDFTSDAARARTVAALREMGIRQRSEAIAWAKANNWPLEKKMEDGTTAYIDRLVDGQPVYIGLFNTNAAISNNAIAVREVAPYYLDGLSIKVGVWDGGQPQTTHQEFTRPGGSRVEWNAASIVGTNVQPSFNRSHATHVIGTIAAGGVDSDARGMAPYCSVVAYSFFDTTVQADMAARVAAYQYQAGYEFVSDSAPYIMMSNHSYGYTSPTMNGVYDSGAVAYDATLYTAPYHLGCFAAGNNNTTPVSYSNIRGYSGGKNVLCVGNTQDAVTSGARNFTGLAMSPSSSWGPMDDGRIKPDVSANGDGLYSTDFGSDTSYTSLTGTSMATPSVTGVVALLQDHALRALDRPLRASAMKALLIHTADDIRNPGPDYQSGYGLVNAKAAADRIAAAAGMPLLISDGILRGPGADRDELYIEPDGINQVVATLCWTDPPGTAQADNSATPVLVHNLNLLLQKSEGTQELPWVLNGGNPGAVATKGGDNINNVEKVQAAPSSGPPWRVIVSTNSLSQPTQPAEDPNRLYSGPFQVYSLVLSGVKYAGTFADGVEDSSLAYSFTGNERWGPQSTTSHDGRDAVQSPNFPGTNRRAGFTGTVAGPGRLTFWYKTTGASGDSFEFTGPGGVVNSNTTTWTKQTVAIPAGTQNLKWEYVRGSGATQGYAWVDEIAFTPTPVITGAYGPADFMNVYWTYGTTNNGTFTGRPIASSTLYRNSTPSLTGATTEPGWSSSGNAGGNGVAYVNGGGWFAVEVRDGINGQTSPLSAWVQSTIQLGFIQEFNASDGVYADRVQLSWSAVPGANEYVITRTPQGGSATTLTVTSTSFSDTAAAVGQVITYTVQGRRTSDGAISQPYTDTGYRLDPSTIAVSASDGTGPAVIISWPYNWVFPVITNRVLRTSNNLSPNNGNNAYTVIDAFGGRATDTTGVPGVTYWYWVQARIRDTDAWGAYGSDTGFAAPPVAVTYAVSNSDNAAGPVFQWIDVTNATKVAGATLVLPGSVSLDAGTQANPVGNVLNRSGLNAEPTLLTYPNVTHTTDAAANWSTNSLGTDYFTSGPAPKLTFFINQSFKMTDLVVWGIAGSANEAKTFVVEPMAFDTFLQQWVVFPADGGVTVTSPAPSAGKAIRIPLSKTVSSHNGRIRVTCTDNWFGTAGLTGGDRVSLGEVRFIGQPNGTYNNSEVVGGYPQLQMYGSSSSILVNSSLHGYLGGTPDNGTDSTNDAVLPATPDLGANGFRLYPYHDAMDTSLSGGVFFQRFINNPHPHGPVSEVLNVWQWQDARLAGRPGSFSFQVLNFETSGDIIFQYLPGNPGGSGATIGLQDSANGKGTLYAANRAGSIPTDRNFAILFRKQAAVPAQPATFTVTTLADENDAAAGQGTGNSLREMINLNPAGSRVVFPSSMAGQTIQLNTPLTVGTIELDGSSAPGLVLSGRNLNRVIDQAAGTTARISNLNIANGVATHGAGMMVNGQMFLENVTISNCRADASTGRGGAIYLGGYSTMTLRNCTISGNSASTGGGIWVERTGSGAGIRVGNFTIIASTITGNTAGSGGGGGLRNEAQTGGASENWPRWLISSSIVAGNTTTGTGPDISGFSGSAGFNLFSSLVGLSGRTVDDLVSATPGLSPLANNGGPVKTHALLPSSPAVDAASGYSGGFFLKTDARGVLRGNDGDYDYPSGPGAGISLAGAVATQSTEYTISFPAGNASDGNPGNFTHTSASDPNPSWTLTLPVNTPLDEVALFNRGDGCCPERLSDITVRVYSDAAASTLVYTSPVLNAANVLAGPGELRALTGGVNARVIRVSKNAAAGVPDRSILSLGEVKLYNYPEDPVPVSTAGAVAVQSSNFPAPYPAGNAIDGDFTNFTHTLDTDPNPTWTMTLASNASIDEVVLANRGDGCCQERLRDVTVQIYSDPAAATLVYTSPLLNPGNILNGPAELRATTGSPVSARVIKVSRTPAAGAATADNRVLSLGEVLLFSHTTRKRTGGADIGSYELEAPFLVTTAADTVDPNDNRLSLREAVALAGGNGGGTIRFDAAAMGGSSITLGSPLNVSAWKGVVLDGAQRPAVATFTILGTGTAALRGGDLTDPENDGIGTGGTKGTKFNWVDITTSDTAKAFFSDGTGGFSEGAYDIFDNQAGGGGAKWCCSAPPNHVTVQFAHPVSLSHFTITSSNDSPQRDPLDWQILGSNDGSTFTPIFTRADNASLWTARDQVVLVNLPAPSPLYRFLRYLVTRSGFTESALGELEFFGPAADRITLSGGNTTRHFQIDGGRAELRNLTLLNGSSPTSGGSIFNRAELALMNCELRNNSSSGDGGAVYGSTGSLMLIDNCTLSGNTAAAGFFGGAVASAGQLELSQSTLSGNTADGGGGLLVSAGNADLTSCTLSNNASRHSTAGAGIRRSGGTLTLGNSIVSGNRIGPDIEGTYLTSSLNNLIGGDAKLAPLGTWGGVLPTHPLLAGSPAVDAGSVSAWPVTTATDPVTPVLANSPAGSGPAAAFDRRPSTTFASPDPSLVAWWPMDASAEDRIGGRSGTSTGAITFAQAPPAGLTGSSARFEVQYTGLISVPYAAVLNPQSFTFTCWARRGIDFNSYRNLCFNRNAAFKGWVLYVDLNQKWTFEVDAPGPGGATIAAGPVSVANQWTHLAATYDAPTRTLKLFVDGTLAVSTVATVPMVPNDSDALRFGNGFYGNLDDASLWRSVLTAEEIAALRSNGVRERTNQLTIRPSDPLRPVHSLRITAAADLPDADPASFVLEGSRDGETFLELARGDIPVIATRGGTQTVSFPARSGWPIYRLGFPSQRGGAASHRFQVAEVELLYNPATDQRGLDRGADGNGDFVFTSDIGAVEARSMQVDTAIDEINGPGNGATTFTSLREALQPVHQADLIRFAPGLSGATIRLATAQGGQGSPLTVSRLASVTAATLPGGLTIDAGGQPSAVIVSAGAASSLDGLTLRGAAGPGLDNAGTVWLNRSTITANTAVSAPGGIRNTGTLTLDDATISGNAAGGGNGGGIGNSGTLTVISSTISANSALTGSGGGVHHSGGGTAVFSHSIVSGNTSAGTRDVQGTIVSSGWNLIGIGDGSTGWIASDRRGTAAVPLNALLGPLADNGGPSFTHALLFGSPALDGGNPALSGFNQTDQRGFPRVFNGIMDAGAYEQSAFASAIVQDRDGDGMNDDWERLYGLNPNSGADGAADPDKDGQSNASEYASRTAPNAASSVLRLTKFTRSPGPGGTHDFDIVWESVRGVVYSVWTSPDLAAWTPVNGTNVIAVTSSTRIMLNVPAAQGLNFFRVRVGAAAGAGDSREPPVEDTFIPVSKWEPATIVSAGNGTPVTRWNDSGTALDDLLAASGAPLFRTAATPTGQSAIEFRGGTFDDALADTVAAGKFGLNGATSFTAAVVFKPDGDSEVEAGNQSGQKSQLLSADLAGPGHDWSLGYAANTIWFGVGAGTGADATISVPAGSTMPGAWWTAVVTWSADDGTGKPSVSAWLYNADGNEVARTGPTDPNTVAGTTGRYHLPRANSGIALGGERGNPSARNFDGHISAARLYPFPVDRSLARSLAAELARTFTSTALPE